MHEIFLDIYCSNMHTPKIIQVLSNYAVYLNYTNRKY